MEKVGYFLKTLSGLWVQVGDDHPGATPLYTGGDKFLELTCRNSDRSDCALFKQASTPPGLLEEGPVPASTMHDGGTTPKDV